VPSVNTLNPKKENATLFGEVVWCFSWKAQGGITMPYTFSVIYMACQTCQSKIHCDECEARLEEAMMRLNGVRGASFQMARKELLIDAEQSEDDLLDALEDLGIFTN
jgi:copper chaperone CopZ